MMPSYVLCGPFHSPTTTIMRTKFIKGTDKQYSIREDGMVTSHYKYNNDGVTKYYRKRIHKLSKGRYVMLKLNGKFQQKAINTLLKEYFGTQICKQCTKLYQCESSGYICNSCKEKNNYKSNLRSSQRAVKIITKDYIAGILKIPVENLPDKLYKQHRKLLQFKRKVAETHNLHIQSLQ